MVEGAELSENSSFPLSYKARGVKTLLFLAGENENLKPGRFGDQLAKQRICVQDDYYPGVSFLPVELATLDRTGSGSREKHDRFRTDPIQPLLVSRRAT